MLVSPFPTKKQVKKVYSEKSFEEFNPKDKTKAGYANYFSREFLMRERFRKRIVLIKEYKKEGKLLDVGCATGFFLSEAEKAGFEVYGIDITKYAVDYCRKQGLKNVFRGTLESVRLSKGKFDVIVALEVLEHLQDPKEFLVKAFQLLAKGGILLVCVPNRKSLIARLMGRFWFGYHNFQHLFVFEPKTISRLVSECGFEIVKIKNSGYDGGLIDWGLVDAVAERVDFYYSSKMAKIVQMFGRGFSFLGINRVPVLTGGMLTFLIAKK